MDEWEAGLRGAGQLDAIYCVLHGAGLTTEDHDPEGTMLAMEVRKSETKGSINKGGSFQTDLLALEVTVKDSKRFKADGWDYFGFGPKVQTAKAIGQQGGCNACHNKNAAVENTFVQFYPSLLEVAKAKGTVKKTAAE